MKGSRDDFLRCRLEDGSVTPWRRSALVLAVAALLLSAGCSGLTGGDGPTETSTGTQTPTTTPADFEYPPGLSESGFETDALMEHHATSLEAAESATVRLRRTIGSGENALEATHVAKSDGDTWLVRVSGPTLGGETGTETTYAANGEAYLNWTVDGNTTYERLDDAPAFPDVAISLRLRSVLGGGNFSATAVDAVNGTTAVQYTADSVANETALEQVGVVGNVTSFDATVWVTDDGVVRSASLSVSYENPALSETRAYEYAVSGVNATTIDEPAWLSSAEERTNGTAAT